MKKTAFLALMALAVSAVLCVPAFAENNHRIVTVSGGDVVSVEGEAEHYRIGYENYSGYDYSFWGFSDDDDYYYQRDDDEEPDASQNGVSRSDISSADAASVQSYPGDYDELPPYTYDEDSQYNGGYYNDGYSGYSGYNDYGNGYNDYSSYGTDAEPVRAGIGGLGVLIALGVGAIVAFTFYASTKHAYENAGIGVVYDLRDNATLALADKIDRQLGTRQNIERGFYGRSGSSAQNGGENLAAPNGVRPGFTVQMVPRPQQINQRPPQMNQRPPQTNPQQMNQRPAQTNARPQQSGHGPTNVPPPRPPRH